MENVLKDSQGIIYKHPERTCKDCKKNPCMKGMETFVCDFAKYGCRQFEGVPWKALNP